MARIRHTLRRQVADQVVVPKDIGIRHLAADVELGRAARDRRRMIELVHGPGGSGTAGGSTTAIVVIRRLLSVAPPASRVLEVGKGFARRSDCDGDLPCGRSPALIPFLDRKSVV